MGWKDVFKRKIGGGSSPTYLPSLGKAVSRAASGMSSATTAVKGAVAGAGMAAGEQIVNAIADPGFSLFIAGVLAAILRIYATNTLLALLFSSVFLFYSTVFIFKARGLVFTSIFWIWYVFFRTISLETLWYILPLAFFIGAIAHGISSKFQKGSFVDGAGGEIVGVIGILFFFLDLGLGYFLTSTFNVPLNSSVQSFLLYTPWWALLGLFAAKKENMLISLAKIGAIIYIFALLLFGVAPQVYDSYNSLVPGPQELLAAKQQVEEQLPHGENPAWSQIVCSFSEYSDVTGCVKRRQEESTIKDACARIEKKQPGTAEFEECLKQQREELQKQKIPVRGAEDPTNRKPLTIQFERGKFFADTVYRRMDTSQAAFPIQLTIANPRQQHFMVELSCSFRQQSTRKEIPGTILGPSTIDVTTKDPTTTIACTGDNLDGSYTLIYEATIPHLSSASRLQRAFIGEKTTEWKEEWIPKIMNAHFPGQNYLSLSPPDLVRLSFAFGSPVENPIIEKNPYLALTAKVENLGRGEITGIPHYQLGLDGFSFNSFDCIEGYNVPLPTITTTLRKEISLVSCAIESLPYELENPSNYVLREFVGIVEFSYRLKEESTVRVEVIDRPLDTQTSGTNPEVS